MIKFNRTQQIEHIYTGLITSNEYKDIAPIKRLASTIRREEAIINEIPDRELFLKVEAAFVEYGSALEEHGFMLGFQSAISLMSDSQTIQGGTMA